MQNTIMLYLLTFSNYFLSLIVVPYETRILTTSFGLLGTATAIMVYFQLIIDFGFLLSGTQEVSMRRNDTDFLCHIFTAITLSKVFLTCVSALLLWLLCNVIPAWEGRTGFYFIFFIGTAATTMLPDYLYRGMERMSAITIRTVCIKAFFTLGIFLFLKTPEDIWVAPFFTAVGNLIALVFSYVDLHRRFGIHFTRVGFREVTGAMGRASGFFFSRIATTAYSALNTVILDMISTTGAPTSYYTSADKLISTGKSALTPISDSLYPYMVKNKDYKLAKKVLLILEPIIIVFCVCVFIWADPLCRLFFGPDLEPAAQVLRAMLPVGIVILPSYILGFPMLSAMGIPKYANYSTIFGSCLHMVNLLVLYLTGHMNMITLGLSMSVAETVILLFRIIVIWKNRSLLRKEPSAS